MTARPSHIRSRLFLLSLASAGCGTGRDVVPASRDVHAAGDVPTVKKSGDGAGYEYVARRPLGTMALAEARGLDPETTKRLVDRLADALQSCAAGLRQEGKLASGAVRVVAQVAPEGTVGGLSVKIAPGVGVAANALLCVVSPIKLLSFAPAEADAGARGFAVEAAW